MAVRKAMSDQRVLELLRYGWVDGLDGMPMSEHLQFGKDDLDEVISSLQESGLAQADDRAIALALQEAADQGLRYDFTNELAAANPYDRGQMLILQGDPRLT